MKALLPQKVIPPKRLVFIAIYTFFQSYVLINPFISVAINNNIKLTPFSFVLVAGNSRGHLIILSSVVIMFADIEKLEKNNLIKATINIFILSLIYEIIIFIACTIWTVPVISLKCDWSGWSALKTQKLADQFHYVLDYDEFLINAYNPIEATMLQLLFDFLLIFVFALIMFTFGTCGKISLGGLCVVFILLFDSSIYNLFPVWVKKFSLVTLAMLTSYQREEAKLGISFSYTAKVMFLVIFVIYFLFLIPIMYRQQKRQKV